MAIIVLGCQAFAGQPGRILRTRLEKALEVALRDPEELFVVSGKSEARPMADWLIAHGVAHHRILIEPTATSTNENLERSLELLLNTGVDFPTKQCPLTVVTSDYHKFRTEVWAWHLEIPVVVISALTPPPHRQQDFSREVFALPHSTLRVLWRKWVALVGAHPSDYFKNATTSGAIARLLPWRK